MTRSHRLYHWAERFFSDKKDRVVCPSCSGEFTRQELSRNNSICPQCLTVIATAEIAGDFT